MFIKKHGLVFFELSTWVMPLKKEDLNIILIRPWKL